MFRTSPACAAWEKFPTQNFKRRSSWHTRMFPELKSNGHKFKRLLSWHVIISPAWEADLKSNGQHFKALFSWHVINSPAWEANGQNFTLRSFNHKFSRSQGSEFHPAQLAHQKFFRSEGHNFKRLFSWHVINSPAWEANGEIIQT